MGSIRLLDCLIDWFIEKLIDLLIDFIIYFLCLILLLLLLLYKKEVSESEVEEEQRIGAGLQMNSPGTLLGGVIPSSCLTFARVLQNVLLFIKCSGWDCRELTGLVT